MIRLGAIGDPIQHSISPAMQTAALEHLGLTDWTYEALHTPAEALPQQISALREESWVGVNITIPHKHSVIKYLDSLDDLAATLGAVNTIVQRAGELRGHNTDVGGFLADLGGLGVQIEGRPTYILGAGGAARAVAYAVASQGGKIHIICRREQEASPIQNLLQKALETRIVVQPWSLDSFQAIRAGSLVINATPVGTWPEDQQSPWPGEIALPGDSFMYDLVYNPTTTHFVAKSLAAGSHAATGLGMLVEQGALGFSLWTGLEAPKSIMRAAAEAALESQHA